MNTPIDSGTKRRTVLKTAGAVGLFSLVGASGTAAAKNGDVKNNRDIGAFLNKPAAYKEGPIWDRTIHDMTGMDEVVVDVGAMTSIDLPPDAPPFTEAPVAFAPQAIKIDLGTTVKWMWTPETGAFEIPHDVVARKVKKGEPVFSSGELAAVRDPFLHTFENAGEYLYYCTPHGAPFAVESFLGDKVNNEFGMRGAVIVTD